MKVYNRDASWYNNPDTTTSKVYHCDDGRMASCCNANMLLSEYTEIDHTEVLPTQLCGRAACKNQRNYNQE